MKFIHAADIHLDSPLRNLTRYEGAPVDTIRSASRRAFENLVELALTEKVDFLLLAGDLFDGDWTDYNSGLFFHRHMVKLREAGIPVISISGNHDAQGRMTRSLDLTGLVHELPTDRAATLTPAQLGIEHAVAIHGRGFANPVVNENVVLEYPEPIPGHFNIGLLHTSLTGDGGEHARYAPCSPTDLINKQYDYWALGHVHTREEVSKSPWIVFPGNLQGRHIREEGAKGCYVVTVDQKQQATVEFRELDVFRWYHCRADVTGVDTPADALDAFAAEAERLVKLAEGRPLAMRVTLSGACEAHRELAGDRERYINELRARATALGSSRLWLEKIRFDTRMPIDAEALFADDGPLSELRAVIDQLQADDPFLLELSREATVIEARLPSDMRQADSPEAVRLSDPKVLRELLGEVESLLIDRLSQVKQEG